MRIANATMTRCAFVCLIQIGLLWSAAQARAAVDWLVLVVDRSGSISPQHMALQRNAYVGLLSDPDVVKMLGAAQVAIVEFDTTPEVVVDWAKPEIAAATYRAAGMPPEPSLTGIGNALVTALELLEGKPGRSVIDISANGRDNVDHVALRRARAAAARRSIEINGLIFLNPHDPGLEAFFYDHVVNGFVIAVEHQEHFLGALRAKFVLEVASAD
jgi:Protein of unknown function (DUF1194)